MDVDIPHSVGELEAALSRALQPLTQSVAQVSSRIQRLEQRTGNDPSPSARPAPLSRALTSGVGGRPALVSSSSSFNLSKSKLNLKQSTENPDQVRGHTKK